jgi:hypothetical protein
MPEVLATPPGDGIHGEADEGRGEMAAQPLLRRVGRADNTDDMFSSSTAASRS